MKTRWHTVATRLQDPAYLALSQYAAQRGWSRGAAVRFIVEAFLAQQDTVLYVQDELPALHVQYRTTPDQENLP